MKDSKWLSDAEMLSASSLHDRLKSAIGMLHAVGHAHRTGDAHGGVRPMLFTVDASTGEAFLTAPEHDGVSGETAEYGDLPYLAPEQAGRSLHPLDIRSDIYSAGVTVYERITGCLPWEAEDREAWLHAHLAVDPQAANVVCEGLPLPIAEVLDRMLKKDPDERYQSIESVICDLKICLHRMESTGDVQSFPLGMEAANRRLRFSGQIYGREREQAELTRLFGEVQDGASSIVWIGGPSGIGKTALADQFLKERIAEGNALVASCKMDAPGQGLGMESMLGAIARLVRDRTARCLNERTREHWRRQLRRALGSNAAFIGGMLPEVKFMLGALPAVESLPPDAACNRFHYVLISLLGALTEAAPAVILIDDVHYADEELLLLLATIIQDVRTRKVLLLGTWKTGTEEHGAPPVLEEVGFTAAKRAFHMELGPIAVDEFYRMLFDVFGTELDKSAEFSELIRRKTTGNLLHARQFLYYCQERQWIRYSSEHRRWEWDKSELEAAEVPDELGAFLAAKLALLPQDIRLFLARTSCFGKRFSLAAAAELCGKQPEEAAGLAAAAVAEGLLVLEEAEGGAICRFAHEQVHIAVSSVLDEESALLRLKAARVLYSRLSEQDEELLFAVADHYYAGMAWIDEREERIRAAGLQLEAGKRAQAISHFTAALRYFEQGRYALRQDDWDSDFDLAFELGLGVLSCRYSSGNEEDEALYEQLWGWARSRSERTRALTIKLHSLLHLGRHREATILGLRGLREYRIRIPEKPGKLRLIHALLSTTALVRRRLDRLDDSVLHSQDAEWAEVLSLIQLIGSAAYFDNKELYALLACVSVQVSVRKGNSAHSAYFYATFALMIGQLRGEYQLAHKLGSISAAMAERAEAPSVIAQTYMLVGSALCMWGSAESFSGFRYLRTGWELAKESGNPIFAIYNIGSYINILGVLGRLDDLVDIEELFDELERLRYPTRLRAVSLLDKQFALNMKGRTAAPFSLTDDGFDMDALVAGSGGEAADPLVIAFCQIIKLKIYYFNGHFAEALRMADVIERSENPLTSLLSETDTKLYTCLAIAAGWDDLVPEVKRRWKKRLNKHQAYLKKLAKASETFTAHYKLIEAETLWLEGQAAAASRFLEAIRIAEHYGLHSVRAIACERAALCHDARGAGEMAVRFMSEALRAYEEWGAERKAEQLRQDWGHRMIMLSRQDLALKSASGTDNAGEEQEALPPDFAAIVKAARSFDGNISLPSVLDKIMMVLLQYSGAQRACLIAARADGLAVLCSLDPHMKKTTPYLFGADGMPYSEAIVWEAIRTGNPVVMDDAWRAGPFVFDRFVADRRCRSVLCLPIAAQQGLLYMENNYAAGLFGGLSTETLHVLATQAYHVQQWLGSVSNDAPDGPTNDRRSHLKRLGEANPDAADLAGRESLTERETEILEMIAAGLTNPEIAGRTGLSLNTIKVHSRNIFGKLGVNNRVKAAARAKEWDLLG